MTWKEELPNKINLSKILQQIPSEGDNGEKEIILQMTTEPFFLFMRSTLSTLIHDAASHANLFVQDGRVNPADFMEYLSGKWL